MLKFTVPLLIVAVIQLILSLGILLESRRSRAIAQRVFVALAATTLAWTLVNIAVLYADTHGSTENIIYFNIANKAGFALGTLSLSLIYIFNLIYPINRAPSLVSKLVVGFGAVIILMTPFQFMSGEFTVTSEVVYQNGIFSGLIVLYGLVAVTAAIMGGARILRSHEGRVLRGQAITMLVGLTLSITHALCFILFLPWLLGDRMELYAIGYFAPFYFTGFTIYSLLKQSLFNVRLIIARSIAYLLVLATIGLIYSLFVFGIFAQLLGGLEVGATQQWFLVIIALILGITFQPLKKFFDHITNEIFYRDAYSAQVLLDKLNQVLASNIELTRLLNGSADLIEKSLKTQYCLFYLKNNHGVQQRTIGRKDSNFETGKFLKIVNDLEDMGGNLLAADLLLGEQDQKLKKQLDSMNVSVLVALITPHDKEVVGYMVIGPKKSGNLFSREDVLVIDIVVSQLSIAVQNALRFEEIQHFNETLQDKIADATRDLRRANDKLKALDETKDEFISMASHQLRTPLTSVKGYLSMVLEGDAGKLKPQQQELLAQAFISSQRMVYLISDLLNVSRLRTGKFIIETKPTDLAEVVAGEVSQLQETASSRGLKLLYDRPEDFPLLELDETKIHQVVMNFIDNAIYYTPSGGRIRVELEAKPTTVELRVIDSGIGVPKAKQHQLFSKFYRADNARRMRPDGTGLGLFMAKKVIIAQGGAIIFNSVEGKGSTFGFVFPRKKLEVVSSK